MAARKVLKNQTENSRLDDPESGHLLPIKA